MQQIVQVLQQASWTVEHYAVDLPHGYLSTVSYVCLLQDFCNLLYMQHVETIKSKTLTTYKISHKRLHYRPTCRQQVGSAHTWNGICISKAEPQKAQKEIISITSSSVWLPPSPSLALPPFPLLPSPSPRRGIKECCGSLPVAYGPEQLWGGQGNSAANDVTLYKYSMVTVMQPSL